MVHGALCFARCCQCVFVAMPAVGAWAFQTATAGLNNNLLLPGHRTEGRAPGVRVWCRGQTQSPLLKQPCGTLLFERCHVCLAQDFLHAAARL